MLVRFLRWLLHLEGRSRMRLVFTEIRYGSDFTAKGDFGMNIDLELHEGDSVTLSVQPTHKGKPAAYQTGSAVWTESNEFVTVGPALNADGTPVEPAELSRTVTALAPKGVTAVSVTLDGDPGGGVVSITAAAAIAINLPAADALDINAGPITEAP